MATMMTITTTIMKTLGGNGIHEKEIICWTGAAGQELMDGSYWTGAAGRDSLERSCWKDLTDRN